MYIYIYIYTISLPPYTNRLSIGPLLLLLATSARARVRLKRLSRFLWSQQPTRTPKPEPRNSKPGTWNLSRAMSFPLTDLSLFL